MAGALAHVLACGLPTRRASPVLSQVMRLCTGEDFRQRMPARRFELRSAGGGGTTRWQHGELCLYINTANTRPNAGQYRNYFWRETGGGSLKGSVCVSLFPGRGQRLSDPSLQAVLGGTPCLLLARKRPNRPFWFCGRLVAAAVAAPRDSATRLPLPSTASDGATPLQAWRTDNDVAPHIIFRLVDAAALFDAPTGGLVDEIFGANGGILMARPAQYSEGVAT